MGTGSHRGYIYDEETGLYYLNSRYYDSVVGRFINADSVIADVGGDVRGYNLYAYCFNNPVNMTDASGCWPEWIKNTVNRIKNSFIIPLAEDCKNFNLNNQSEKKVLESNFFSIYKGVPVLRIDGQRSGAFGILFITKETNVRINENIEDVVRHEYGHVQQMRQLGVIKYALCIFVPLYLEWGNEPSYYDRPWEVTADIYGGVISRVHSQSVIDAGTKYLECSRWFGIWAWTLIERN